MKLSLAILDKTGAVKLGLNDYEEEKRPLSATGEDFVDLATQALQYEDGDVIHVEVAEPGTFLVAKLDETLDSSLVYLKDNTWDYQITMTENAYEARPDKRFASKRHYLSVRLATAEEITSYRNWALNPHDQKEANGAYPHAHANVETRNDATFFACNAIDGLYANLSHGSYPYVSWGINRQEDAALTIDFGRAVTLDKVVFTLRSDFPHDNFWKKVTVAFSDGTSEDFATVKTNVRQAFTFKARTVTSVTFQQLIKSADESPFPALTQIEFFGKNA